ncbi:MAG: hypothetical protein IKD87_01770 [Oscillospiraceae bacterium]|nr:hypothetical protein [Oscillospiraceae bacterium]
MKKRFLLSSLLIVPAAIAAWLVFDRVEVPSGFYKSELAFLIAGLLSVVISFFVSFSIASYAAGHGIPSVTPSHGPAWLVLNILFAMLVLLNILCRFTYFRPDIAYMLPLWAIAIAFECVAMICIYLRVISKSASGPLSSVLLSLGPCLFFTADLLNRFFCSSVNRNNIPLMVSFLSCGSLAVTALRMMQTVSADEPSAQRQFLSSALCSLVFCIGLRLPSLVYYLRLGDLYEISCLAMDCIASIVLYQEAYLTIPAAEAEDRR